LRVDGWEEGMTKEGLAKLLDALEGDKREVRKGAQLPEAAACELQVLHRKMYTTEKHFQSGDLVTPVKGLSVYRFPEVGQPAIVVEWLGSMSRDIPSDGEQIYRRDLVVGVVLEGVLCEYAVDSRRFEPWPVAQEVEEGPDPTDGLLPPEEILPW